MIQETSRYALRAGREHHSMVRQEILALLEQAPLGMTGCEITSALGQFSVTVWARITELKQAGIVFDTGRRRRTVRGRPAAVIALRELPESLS